MANPQKEYGYTPIANEIMEALARISIKSTARQVLDFILRRTYGFNKKKDQIYLNQFCLGTGLTKGQVCKSLNRLINMKIIVKIDNGKVKLYEFNKDFDTWKPLSKLTITIRDENAVEIDKNDEIVVKTDNRSKKFVVKTDNESLSKLTTDIYSSTKVECTKESPLTPHGGEEWGLTKAIDQWNSHTKWSLPVGFKNSSISQIGLLRHCRETTLEIQETWRKINPSEDKWKLALKNYIGEIADREPVNGYALHRFSFYEFIKQKNGYKKFVNR